MVKILGIVMAVLFVFGAVGIAIEHTCFDAWDYMYADEDRDFEEGDDEG